MRDWIVVGSLLAASLALLAVLSLGVGSGTEAPCRDAAPGGVVSIFDCQAATATAPAPRAPDLQVALAQPRLSD